MTGAFPEASEGSSVGAPVMGTSVVGARVMGSVTGLFDRVAFEGAGVGSTVGGAVGSAEGGSVGFPEGDLLGGSVGFEREVRMQIEIAKV